MRVAEAIELDAHTERGLRTLSKGRRVEARVQQRASVILLAAQGWQNKDIADAVRLDRRQVALWRRRFIEGGLEALLQDAARSGRTPSVTLAVESLILSRTLHEPPAAAAHWSSRALASHLGLSATTIRRVWQRNGIQPHLQDTFKASRERDRPRFEDRPLDVAGLFMNPPEHALVLGCDGRSSHSHDHQRHGTAALFAALDTLDGAVVPARQDRQHRQEAWLQFLRRVDRRTPRHLQLHLIVDHEAAHPHPQVQAWLARRPRWVVHVTPARASWLNVVKRFFRDVAENRFRHEGFASVAELQQAMAQHIGHHQHTRKAFVWTARAAPARGGR